MFRSLERYTPGTFEGWLHRITTNLFLDGARRAQRIRFGPLADDAADRLPGRDPTPEQAYVDATFDSDVQAALDSLAPEFRAAVVLCDIEGLSYEEIAEILDVPLGTVRSRIHRGRSQLRAAPPAPRPGPACDPGGRGRVVNGHLGDRAAAYVDGALGPDETARADRSPRRLRVLPRQGRRAAAGPRRAARLVPRRRRPTARADLFAALASMPSDGPPPRPPSTVSLRARADARLIRWGAVSGWPSVRRCWRPPGASAGRSPSPARRPYVRTG